MTKLPEYEGWIDNLYQIATTDPVVGGAPDPVAGLGIANIQAAQLGGRTAYLRDLIAPIAAVTGAVIQPGAAVWSADGHIMQNGGAAAVTLTGTTRADMITDGLRDWVIADYTANDVFAKVKAKDGPNSGLSAEFLGGQRASYFAPASSAVTTVNIGTKMAAMPTLAVGARAFLAPIDLAESEADLQIGARLPGSRLAPAGVTASMYGGFVSADIEYSAGTHTGLMIDRRTVLPGTWELCGAAGYTNRAGIRIAADWRRVL